MGQLEFFACTVRSRLITSDESISSHQFRREFISLSNTIWIGSNGCTSAEKSEKQEGRLSSVKIKATFPDMLNVSSVTFERLYRKTSYLQHKLFRPRPIQRRESQANLIFFVWAKRSWSRGPSLKYSRCLHTDRIWRRLRFPSACLHALAIG